MTEVDLKLSNGYTMPAVGLGTFTIFNNPPGVIETAVKTALDSGYRLIDTARVYENEKLVGAALKEKLEDGTIARKDLFVTTKLWNTDHHPDRVEPALRAQLVDLNLDYIDLYLMHWPLAYPYSDGKTFPRDSDGNLLRDSTSLEDTWKAMEKCVKLGLVRSIGISNFSIEQTKRIIACAEIKPVNMQVELNPYYMNAELANFCLSEGMTVTCYGPIGAPGRTWRKEEEPNLLDDALVVALAQKYGKTPANIILRYLLQKGLATIPKSVTPSRIKENAKFSDFVLDDAEMSQMDGLDRDLQVYWEPEAVDHPEYPFRKTK